MTANAIVKRASNVRTDAAQGRPHLRLVPILGPSHDRPAYALLRPETVAAVRVTEVSDAGSVPVLRVHNDLDVRAFLMDGQELVGAKQNRILNTDVLVPAKGTLDIPVSCVEQGRWQHVSPSFSGGKTASHRVRSGKHGRVHASLRNAGRHDADQQAVWEEVGGSLAAAAAPSETMALSDAYRHRDRELRAFRADLRLPKRAVGVAAFHGGQFQGLDLFDRHSTLAYFWASLVDSYAIDLLAEAVDPSVPAASDEAQAVRVALDHAAAAGTWESFASPGEGRDWRLGDASYSGSALVWDERVVVHLQLFPRRPRPAAEAGDVDGVGGRASFRPRVRRRYGPRS